MSTITIEITEKQREALLEIASKDNKSEKQVCLEVIEEYLSRKRNMALGREMLLRLGKGLDKGPGELADKHDEYLYGESLSKSLVDDHKTRILSSKEI